ARRDELLAERGPLRRFRGLKLRFILRATRTYAQLARRLLRPEFLRDGADRSIEMDRLARAFALHYAGAQDPPPWEVYHAERAALERQDIPFFSYFSAAEELLADGRVVVPTFFRGRGLDYVA